MERPLLQAPRLGRSRFSKALPAPPPELKDDRPQTASRELPSLSYSPFPPRKDSVSVKTSTSPSIKSSLGNSPLPAPPSSNSIEATQSQIQMKSIPRKPVGLPANPAPAAAAGAGAGAGAANLKKMRRVSSISSLLSAYSNTSSDSVQRSSQGSIYTKDSEPSNSPEREGINDAQQSLTKTLPVLPSNPYVDEVEEALRMTNEMIAAELPPPPPLKDVTRPSTPPSNGLRLDTSSAPVPGAHEGGSPASPLTIGSASPQRREIWRRRASSKSDGGLLVPELKLSGSHGSTASTSQPSQPPDSELPPPPASQTNNISNTTSPLPPRNGSLPGRNIRPNRPTESQGENDEMRKFSSKLKELTGRGDRNDRAKGADGPKDEPSEMGRHSEGSKPTLQFQSEASLKPAPPTKYKQTVDESSTRKSNVSSETVVFAPSSSVRSSEPPPKESAEKQISRRPIGTPAQSQPEVHKKVSSSDPRRPNLGLPRFPRPSQSNPSLRPPSGSRTAQEATRPQVMPQANSPVAVPMKLPTDSNEPIKKPELFNLVTALNEPTNVSPGAIGNRMPPRKVSKGVDATALSDIGESMEQMTPEQAEQVNEALSRFPRNAIQAPPPADIVWDARPISSRHYNCYVRHDRWVPVKNTNYPLACQTCGGKDTGARKTCSWCNLRICFKCHERLTGPYKSDLRLLMQNMEMDQYEEKRREKGKQTAAS
ncbi:hypothetical protein GGR54DRAFT_477618 [Hypoxylon sp. NC1633]|nr:hypothetical protein GGR54DRAFT_477618 [Hypoxylon sp. NC1633]